MLRPATPDDFGFVRALASHPDNAPFITDEDEAALAAYLTDPAARLLIWQDDGGHPLGYALFCEIGDPSGRVELRRLALAQTGGGRGRAFLRALIDHGFAVLGARRLWLDASGENPRAVHLYTSMGFTEEGRLRDHWFRPATGRTVDLVLMGMLRSEWQAGTALAGLAHSAPQA